ADLSGLAIAERDDEAERLIRTESQAPFNLAEGPLFRARLLRLTEQNHVLLVTMHHIVSDGWSMNILVRELTTFYSTFVNDAPAALPALPVQYADFAVWQRSYLTGEVLERQLSYWQRQLQQPLPLLELPSDRRRPPVQTYRGAQHTLELSVETSRRLKEVSRQNGATAFMTLLAAFKVLLLRHTGQEDVIVGTPIAGRNRAEVEGLIGFLVNTLVMRTNLAGDPSFRELLHRVREVTLEAYQHQDLPFEKLVDALQVPRDPAHTPLFQVMFAFQNLLPNQVNVQGLEISLMDLPDETAKFDLILAAAERGEQTVGTIVYNTDLFEPATIERLADHFVTLVDAVAADPSLRLSELSLLADEERSQLLELGQNRREYPCGKTIGDLFERQVELTPDAIAVEFENTRFTYRQLNEKANQLARYLRRVGVSQDSLVGLCVERSVELISSVIGILKAGGAYLPLDPSYPQERLSAMLADAQVRVLITQESLASRLPESSAPVVLIDSDRDEIARESVANPDGVQLSPNNLAYVMYTSGSTGRPKGVSVTQRNIVRLVKQTNYAAFNPEQVFLQLAPISFDASTLEIWGALLNGARLVVMPPQAAALEELAAVLTERRITTLWLTAGLFHQMVEHHASALGSLRYLLAGGDVLSPQHVTRVLQTSSTVRLVNGYGPTETTTFACCHVMNDPDDVGDTVSIGRPIANTETYLLDQRLQLVPLGSSGELFIGGDGVARGYLNRPDLTAERFVPNPFSTEPGARLYRTGDMARYRNDGTLEFQGRRDYQVKVRGFRIELGEVEVALTEHPAVKEAVVVAHDERVGDKRLVAYLMTDEPVSPGELRSFLKDKLPDYMVPAAFVSLDEFPLTANGKIDRRALPLPEDSEQHGELTPKTPVQDMLANIWADVLDQRTPGLHDDFFEIGGHSLLATQVITRIRKAFQLELPLQELFINPTVAGLAQVIDDALKEVQGVVGPPLERVSRDRDLPLSFAQQRLWFIDQLEPNNAAYNLPVAVRLKGSLDVAALKRSLSEVLRRHEVLRTVFKLDASGPVQHALPSTEFALPVIDLSDLDPEARESDARELGLTALKRPFDLAQGPLVRAGLIKLANDEHVLHLVMHHIVGDAWSLEIFLHEVVQLYQAFRAEQPSPLPELAVQYADYACWQREWLQGEPFAKLLAYWKPRLEGAPALLELPADRPRPPVQTSRGDRHTFTIGSELTGELKRLSRREGATIFMTLLAAFQTLLSRYAGVEDIVVGADVNNRTRLETEGLIGFFINMLVLRTDLSGNPTFTELLARVRQTALGAYAHQEMPLEKLVEELQPERNLSYSPLFQVVFNFNNGSTPPPQLPDLQLSPVALDFTEVKFDLSLFMWDRAETLTGMWTYNTDLFNADRIHRMHEHFVTLLQNIVAEPEQRLNALEYLTEAEREASAAAKRKLKQANFQKFKGLRPQAIKHSRVDLIQTEMLSPDEPLPLVIRPDSEEVDLIGWAKDNLQFIDAQLAKHGALLFRDFGVSSLAGFTQFTRAISPELLDYSEPSSPRTHLQDRIYTSTEYPADQWIQLHNEMSYAHTWPRRVYFFCDQPAQEGGETPIALSRKVFELLDAKLRERFMQRKVMYVRNFGDGLDLPWQHVFHTDDKAAVAAYCRAANVEFEWNNGRLKTRQVRQAVIKHPETGETVWFNQAHAFHASTLDAAIREFLLSEKTEDEFPRNAY
ncbi:MAG TPA: amino acid adenylation domain-containing protein, partial [Pyrinomonadaceae bacterium]|nr:amino acid adenylation domain-containing protein [Pyrinomonadaceae bacterium]